jgi:hypothetical protein
MREIEPDVLELPIKHDRVLEELYQLFTASFPDYRELWRRIARDQQEHSNWLEALRSDAPSARWLLATSHL